MLKFEVENLGRIAEAKIALSPLTILVGKNNTGKSYLASAIWALGNIDDYSLNRSLINSGDLPAWLTQFLAPGDLVGRRHDVTAEQARELARIVAKNFHRNVPEYLSRVFAVEGFETTRLEILKADPRPFTLEFVDESAEFASKEDRQTIVGLYADLNDGENRDFLTMFRSSGTDVANLRSVGEIAGLAIFGSGWSRYSRQMYIPASRTGIMLALPALVEQYLNPNQEGAVAPFPLPLRTFLSLMTRERMGFLPINRSGTTTRMIEELLGGEIRSVGGQTGVYRYAPKGQDLELPMHATSSMISELTPFLIAAEQAFLPRHFVFEEPEAHLHLAAQREIARLIARLLSAGAFVTLTTHSDTFLQEVNNLMKLHSHPDRERLMVRLGYKPDDLIDPTKASAYEFTSRGDETIVTQLEKSQGGFVVPSLNETLMSLAEDTLALREADDE